MVATISYNLSEAYVLRRNQMHRPSPPMATKPSREQKSLIDCYLQPYGIRLSIECPFINGADPQRKRQLDSKMLEADEYCNEADEAAPARGVDDTSTHNGNFRTNGTVDCSASSMSRLLHYSCKKVTEYFYYATAHFL
uniref:Uncharacterized protein n=1 Tax=Ascaris lumbricoides TaxID=6252 RepID=A0A0M3IXG3_ASCLU